MKKSIIKKKRVYNPKKNNIKVYQLADNRFVLGVYNKGLTMCAIPEFLNELQSKRKRFAYTTYAGSKRGSITSYELECPESKLEDICNKNGYSLEVRQVVGVCEVKGDFVGKGNQLLFFKGGGGKWWLTEAEEKKLSSKNKYAGFRFFNPKNSNHITRKAELDDSVDTEYNIFCEHVDLGEGDNQKLKLIQRYDIIEFNNVKSATEKRQIITKEKHFKIKNSIKPNPRFYPRVLTLDKLAKTYHLLFKDGKGSKTFDYEDICQIDIGIDFSLGCINTVNKEFLYAPKNRCGYCYSFQNGPCFLDSVYDFTKEYFKQGLEKKIEKLGIVGKKIINIRIGQVTDGFIPKSFRKLPGYKDTLKIALEFLVEMKDDGYDFNVIFPSKMIEFREEYVDLFKQTNTSLMASIGYACAGLEKGALEHGFTVEKRLSELLKYAQAGVTSSVYIATDFTRDTKFMNADAIKALKFAEKHKDLINMQLLDMRVKKKAIAKALTGSSWDELLSSGKYHHEGKPLAASKMHPSFLELQKKYKKLGMDVRFCYTHPINKAEAECGSCFIDECRG